MIMRDEHAEVARNLWLSGKKGGEIVNYFGGLFTRSQILGKLYRMGVVGQRRTKVLRVAQEKQKRNQQRAKATMLKPAVRSDGMPFAKPVPMPTPSNAAQRSFNTVSGPSYDLCDLNRLDCHWPLGDPMEAGFAYCSAPVVGVESYCYHHCKIAYNRPR